MMYTPSYSPEDLGHTALFAGDKASHIEHEYGRLLTRETKDRDGDKGGHFIWLSDLGTVFSMYSDYHHHGGRDLVKAAKKKGYENTATEIHESLFREGSEFRGANPKDILKQATGEVDLAAHRKARSKIWSIGSEVERYLLKSRPGRRRMFSAEDGDLIQDRIYDVAPFATTARPKALQIPRLTVVCNMSFSGGVSADFINRHCALTWALVDMFEGVGILCTVYSTAYIQNMSSRMDKTQMIFELKKHDSYVAPSNIARGLSTAFFRRLCFLSMAIAPNLIGDDVRGGLGSVFDRSNTPTFKDGILYVHESLTEQLGKLGPEKGSKWLLEQMMPGLKEMGLNGGEQWQR